jgi:hypothetical protein
MLQILPRPSAGAFLLVAPVLSVGFDPVGGEYFAGVEVDDRDGAVVGDGEDAFSGVGSSGGEVVHAAGAAEAHFPGAVGAVVAQPEVFRGAGFRGSRFRGCPVGGSWGVTFQGAVRALLVASPGREYPYSAAASVTESCLLMMRRTTTRAFDMGSTVAYVATHQSPINCRLCPELRHPRLHWRKSPLRLRRAFSVPGPIRRQ